MSLRSLGRGVFATLVMVLGLLVVVAPDAAKAETRVYQSGGLFSESFAINGYDAVAYHRERRPVAGNDDYTHRWDGASWRFANSENRDLFAANPEKYAPAYGGYCAWAVSKGYTASTDPEAWSIVDGRLYLNYSKGVQAQWEQDIPGNIASGDRNWPGISAKLE